MGVLDAELTDKLTDCGKEFLLYTGPGSTALSALSPVIPVEVVHIILIFAIPCIFLAIRHRHRERVMIRNKLHNAEEIDSISKPANCGSRRRFHGA